MDAVKIVAVFGDSRVQEGSPAYEEARRLGQLLARSGFTVVNGGYQGTMEAVSRGVKEGGGRAIGVTAALFDPLPANPWLDQEIKAQHLFDRLERLISLAEGFVVLRGSMGTLAELALVWNMARIKPTPPRPIILVGQGWRRVMGTFLEELAVTQPEVNLLTIVQTPEEAVAVLCEQLGESPNA
ncbi:MAG: LOG family protein [Anaerolineae bacterium]